MHAAAQRDFERAQAFVLMRGFGQDQSCRVERAPGQTGRIQIEPATGPHDRHAERAGQAHHRESQSGIAAGNVVDGAAHEGRHRETPSGIRAEIDIVRVLSTEPIAPGSDH